MAKRLWGRRSKKALLAVSQNSHVQLPASSPSSSGRQQIQKTKDPDNTQKKKKDPDNTQKKKKSQSKSLASIPKDVSRSYTSPLMTIEEHHEDQQGHATTTPATEVASPVLQSHVVEDADQCMTADESMEVVVGSAASTQTLGPSSEPTILLDKIHVFENKKADSMEVVVAPDTTTLHDDLRKQLFPEEQEEERRKVDEGKQKEEPVKGVSEESPFDQLADYSGKEDPAILDLIDDTSKAESGSESGNSITAKDRGHFKSDVRDAILTRKLFEMMQCNLDTTRDRKVNCGMDMFYDTMCASEPKSKRPFFSKEFTRDFLEDAANDGIPLMYHFEGETDGEMEWKGRSVNMFVRQGNYQGSTIVHPRLEWPTPEQQLWTTEQPGTVNLLDIQSISDSTSDEVRDDIEVLETMDLCFFSITTKNGDVYMFESSSPVERDWIVTGLKNVIVRLSYHLTVGDPGVSSELFSAQHDDMTGDLPTLRTRVQAMNEVTHAFLD